MWTYVTEELPCLIGANFPADLNRQSILGHSMGGDGALTIALSFPSRFKAVSAFAPIVAPSQVHWAHKARGGYIGEEQAAWRSADLVTLIGDGARVPERPCHQGDTPRLHEKQI